MMSTHAMQTTTDRRYHILLGLAIVVNLSGLFVTILGPDGALYASIAKTMAQTNNYIELFGEGKDWLDKPHFPFWITAFSFELFGVNTWAYKLPAILFLFMGAGYTWLLAKALYNKQVALWSVIILLTAEHIILSNNDVRAEPYLTGLIIGSVYHFYRAYTSRSFGHLVLGSLLAGCAMMTKGPFALVPIGGAIAGDLLIKKNWKDLFHLRWLFAAVLIGIFISPELYCLYYQFDAHPEKTVFGRTGVSGIRFFFWDSQFGRFMNTGPIKGKGDPFFFIHTLLWAFLPWSVLLYVAIYRKIKTHWKQAATTEWLTLCGALLCLALFSLSKFQLPHYTNIIFPFFAILTAQFVLGVEKPVNIKRITTLQTVIIVICLIAPVAIHLLFRPGHTVALIILLAFMLVVGWSLYGAMKKNGTILPVLVRTVFVALLVNFYLNLVFYPALLEYQSGSEAASVANKDYPDAQVVQLRQDYSYGLEFYVKKPLLTIDQLSDTTSLPAGPILLYARPEAMTAYGRQPVKTFEHFHVSRLTLKLVNHATRAKELQTFGLYVLRP